MLKYFDYSIYESQKHGEVLLPKEKAFGVSVWTKPLTENLEAKVSDEKKAFIKSELGESCLETYKKIVKFMSEKTESLIDSDAWYLSIVGVHPKYQGMGNGVKLISPILAQADQLNVPTFLETFTPRNKKFYSQLGYKEIGVFYEPTTEAEYSVMKREARVG